MSAVVGAETRVRTRAGVVLARAPADGRRRPLTVHRACDCRLLAARCASAGGGLGRGDGGGLGEVGVGVDGAGVNVHISEDWYLVKLK